VQVSIPYIFLGSESAGATNQTEFVYLFDEKKCYAFCQAYPDKCPLKHDTKVEYVVQKENRTLTEDQWKAMMDEKMRLKNKVDELSGKIDSSTATTQTTMKSIDSGLDYNKNISEQSLEKAKNQNTSVAFLILVGLAFVCVVASAFLIPKVVHSKKASNLHNEGRF